MIRFAASIALLGLVHGGALAQADRSERPAPTAPYYTIGRGSMLYSLADSTIPYVELGMREPVWVLEEGKRWAHVRTRDGAQGLIRTAEISNVWIRIAKASQTVFVYRGDRLEARIPADLGHNFFADKEKRGSDADPDHWRTPEGVFHVVQKNPRSQFHRAFVLNYPSEEDAERGLKSSLISRGEYESIVSANRSFSVPPMGTSLGGWIEVHGRGTGQRANWTQGCVAIPDEEMDRLWDSIHVGTPVVIER